MQTCAKSIKTWSLVSSYSKEPEKNFEIPKKVRYNFSFRVVTKNPRYIGDFTNIHARGMYTYLVSNEKPESFLGILKLFPTPNFQRNHFFTKYLVPSYQI